MGISRSVYPPRLDDVVLGIFQDHGAKHTEVECLHRLSLLDRMPDIHCPGADGAKASEAAVWLPGSVDYSLRD
ncbi:MAG: hypothetical protein J6W00_14995 [Lentisphaeria bacterium]|nr:hypothetical protein [Lentisphaeria bacterium]